MYWTTGVARNLVSFQPSNWRRDQHGTEVKQETTAEESLTAARPQPSPSISTTYSRRCVHPRRK